MVDLHTHINGDRTPIVVERAATELYRGRAVRVVDAGRVALFAALESASPDLLVRLEQASRGRFTLYLTAERARVMKLPASGGAGPVSITLPRGASPAEMARAAGLVGGPPPAWRAFARARDSRRVDAALTLTKWARLLPALVGFEDGEEAFADVLEIEVSQVVPVSGRGDVRLRRVSEARVPVAGQIDCRLVLFRDDERHEEHVAVVLGQPDLGAAVPVRLHSACLTGDLLGSLRCDCGPQLRGAVRRIGDLGGGVLLYLAQEGRGIGLANKLRAYTLQDGGLDTVDADLHLGFRSDERTYHAAAQMLHALGVGRVRLLTNNPDKIQSLRDGGLEVVGRIALSPESNPHNERYLRAKRERAGHLADEPRTGGSERR